MTTKDEPEVSKLKRLAEADAQAVADWLTGTPQDAAITLVEARARLARAHGINLRHDSQLSRWHSWWRRRQALEQANSRAEQLAEWFAKSGSAANAETIREAQLAMLSIEAEERGDHEFQLAVAKELRQSENLRLIERRVRLLERQAEAVKSTLADGKLTPAQREEKMREVFGLA